MRRTADAVRANRIDAGDRCRVGANLFVRRRDAIGRNVVHSSKRRRHNERERTRSIVRIAGPRLITHCVVPCMLHVSPVLCMRRVLRDEATAWNEPPAVHIVKQHEADGHERTQRHERQQPDQPALESATTHYAREYSREDSSLKQSLRELIDCGIPQYFFRRSHA
jgi:hypothetical protein